MTAQFTRTLAVALVLALGASSAFAATTRGNAGPSGPSGPSNTGGNHQLVVDGPQNDCNADVRCVVEAMPKPKPVIVKIHCHTVMAKPISGEERDCIKNTAF